MISRLLSFAPQWLTLGNSWVILAAAVALFGAGAYSGAKVATWAASSKIAEAEKALSDYQLSAADVITQRLREAVALQTRNAKLGTHISSAYLEGKHESEQSFKVEMAELAALRAALAGGNANPAGAVSGRVRDATPADGNGSSVPAPASPTSRTDVQACTSDATGIIAAAERVVADLAACDTNTKQLVALQKWVREVCSDEGIPK